MTHTSRNLSAILAKREGQQSSALVTIAVVSCQERRGR